MFATGYQNGKVLLSYVQPGHVLQEGQPCDVHDSCVTRIQFHQPGSNRQLVSAGGDGDGSVKLWNIVETLSTCAGPTTLSDGRGVTLIAAARFAPYGCVLPFLQVFHETC